MSPLFGEPSGQGRGLDIRRALRQPVLDRSCPERSRPERWRQAPGAVTGRHHRIQSRPRPGSTKSAIGCRPPPSCSPFPALEALPYERTPPEPTIVQQRQAVLDVLVARHARGRRGPGSISASAPSGSAHLSFSCRTISVERAHHGWARDSSLGIHGLCRRQSGAQSRRAYCRRGGLLDIFPAEC